MCGARKISARQSIGFLMAWMLPISVLFSLEAHAQSRSLPELTIDDTVRANQVRGVAKARYEAIIAANITAQIAELPFREGERFQEGETLVAFDCAPFRADLDAAQAEAAAAEAERAVNRELASYGAAGTLEVRQSEAAAESANARVRALALRLEFCSIDAPFTGSVAESYIQVHETPAENAPLLRILDDTALELHLVVPSNWLAWLQAGTHFEFAIDETAMTYPAKVERIGAEVDPVSQTVKIVGMFYERPERVLAGMSGSAIFDVP